MRKSLLRICGLLVIAGSLIVAAPARQAAARSVCACFTLCVSGKRCCTFMIGDQCMNECIADVLECPPSF